VVLAGLRVHGGGGGRMEPIITLTEESSGVDELMRHVNTG